MTTAIPYDMAIIGAGLFGARSAILLAKLGLKVILIDERETPLQRASYVNQARIHNGYHYPRSLMTALGSHQNYERFKHDYGACLVEDFQHIYAIAAKNSKCTAFQFQNFCHTVGIPLKPPPREFEQLINQAMFEGAFLAEEAALDTRKLGSLIAQQLSQMPSITCKFGYLCRQLEIKETGVNLHLVEPQTNLPQELMSARGVLVACYGGSNDLLLNSGLSLLKLKAEITEIALVQVPLEFRDYGITVMDGPFFSCIPFAAKGCWSLTHVRYTPHLSWELGQEEDLSDEEIYLGYLKQARTRFAFMRNDAARFIPCLRQVEYRGSLFEIKTVPIKHETDDGRPIFYRGHYGTPGDFPKGPFVFSVLGSKLDSVYEWEKVLCSMFS